jgi:hypothetical protein
MIDGHVHIFPPELIRNRESYLERDDRFRTLYQNSKARMVSAEDVLEHMDSCQVGCSVVFGFAFADQGLCRFVNDYVIESVKAEPERLIGLASVSPESAGAVDEAARCLDAGLAGCGELVPQDGAFGGDWHRLADMLARRDAPLLIHANEQVGHSYPGKEVFPPEQFADFAEAHPTLTIVLAHMGGGLLFYEMMPEMRQILRRVHYDTSAVPYLYGPEIYRVAVLCAGPDKIIFGSDFPLLSPSRYLSGIAELTPKGRDAVLGENARRIYRR